MAVTKRQRQVYDFIAGFVRAHGYSPSFEEIGNGLGLSSLATVHKHITNLEKKGLLRRDYNRSRSIDVLAPRGRMKQAMGMSAGQMPETVLPLVGRIAAGRPVEDGEIVVALVNGSETTLKRFYIEGDRIRLQPSNAAMAPIMVPAEGVEIQGRVVGVLRKY